MGTGGGVHIATNSIFTMYDNSSVSKNTSARAGGVVITNNSTFTMNGSASVSGNISVPFYNVGYGTGGVEVINSSTFTMQGNTMVSGNTGFNGGGVRIEDYVISASTPLLICMEV